MLCNHCKGEIEIRDPSGFCDHLDYPNNCIVCKHQQSLKGIETVWIPVADYKPHIWAVGDNAKLEGIDGKIRWVITREDGTKYICRPKES